MKLTVMGGGKRLEACADIVGEELGACRFDEIILLTIPSSRDRVNLTGTNIPLHSVIDNAEGNSLIVGYGLPAAFVTDALIEGLSVFDLCQDEIFLRENAEISAYGAVGNIMTRHKKSVSQMSIGIIGYGRIGKVLSRLLLFLGAQITVFTRREETRLELCGVGIDAKTNEDIRNASGLDIIINTAPAHLLSIGDVNELHSRGVELIDVASADAVPDGEGVVRLLSIPDKMYPISAGKIYASAVVRAVNGGGRV